MTVAVPSDAVKVASRTFTADLAGYMTKIDTLLAVHNGGTGTANVQCYLVGDGDTSNAIDAWPTQFLAGFTRRDTQQSVWGPIGAGSHTLDLYAWTNDPSNTKLQANILIDLRKA